MFDSSYCPKLTNMKTKLMLNSKSNFLVERNIQGSVLEELKSTVNFIKTLFIVAKKVFML